MFIDYIRTINDFPSPGIKFKDITPLLADKEMFQKAIKAMAEPFMDKGITHVVSMEARGFILGSAVAYHLGAGFIPLRKAGKLPSFTHRIESVKEYGCDVFEANLINLDSTSNVLIIDDVLATGGTAKAAFNLVQGVNALVMGFSFLLELVYLKGRESIPKNLQVNSLIQVQD
ncbi:MAG: adenine phosphoribosyltransferase [Bacillota bacterium]|jgi:adenine phosphoribosyltransferase